MHPCVHVCTQCLVFLQVEKPKHESEIHHAYMICPYIHVWDICKELTLEFKKTSIFIITQNLLKFTQMVPFVGKLVTILYTKSNLQFNYMVLLFFW